MKVYKSKFNEGVDIYNQLPQKRITVFFDNKGKQECEGIWVAVDEKHNVQYLLNHAVMFSPYRSWGMEIPMGDNIDLSKFRSESPDTAEFTVAPEAWNTMVEEDYLDPETCIVNEKNLLKWK